jgi:hypothetical protein
MWRFGGEAQEVEHELGAGPGPLLEQLVGFRILSVGPHHGEHGVDVAASILDVPPQ